MPFLFSCAVDTYDYSDYDEEGNEGDYYNGAGTVTDTTRPPPVEYEPGLLPGPGYGSNCEFEGRTYADGETFEPEACTKCTCFQGSVNCERDLCGDNTCAGVLCPEVECENKYIPLGQCCPVCPGG